jgi:phytoene/squalene synthetase
MEVTLTAQAEEALRRELARSPGRQPEEVVEQALTEMSRRSDVSSATGTAMTRDGFRAWLQELRQGTRPAPHLVNETFPREMIYRDHD